MEIIVASNNSHKIKEIKDKLAPFSNITIKALNCLGKIPEIIENGSTFKENALIKARAISQVTDSAVLSDDSGLVVDALNGEPGVYSARYGNLDSDNEKNLLLLSKLNNLEFSKRSARFVCVMVLVLPGGNEFIAEGTCEGFISETSSGNHGFGYDPIFYIPEYNKTLAELPLEIKNTISHRAKALDHLTKILSKSS